MMSSDLLANSTSLNLLWNTCCIAHTYNEEGGQGSIFSDYFIQLILSLSLWASEQYCTTNWKLFVTPISINMCNNKGWAACKCPSLLCDIKFLSRFSTRCEATFVSPIFTPSFCSPSPSNRFHIVTHFLELIIWKCVCARAEHIATHIKNILLFSKCTEKTVVGRGVHSVVRKSEWTICYAT